MTHIPIPEERRRELAAFIPDLAEARRRYPFQHPDPERRFWTKRILDIRTRSGAFPTTAVERLWLLRHAPRATLSARFALASLPMAAEFVADSATVPPSAAREFLAAATEFSPKAMEFSPEAVVL